MLIILVSLSFPIPINMHFSGHNPTVSRHWSLNLVKHSSALFTSVKAERNTIRHKESRETSLPRHYLFHLFS
jgi:hypothetical protein